MTSGGSRDEESPRSGRCGGCLSRLMRLPLGVERHVAEGAEFDVQQRERPTVREAEVLVVTMRPDDAAEQALRGAHVKMLG